MRAIAVIIAACVIGACNPQTPPAPKEDPGVVATPFPADESVAPPALVISQAGAIPAAPDGGVSADGWGAVRVGMTLEQLNAVLQAPLNPNDDPDFAEYQCTFLHPKEAPKGVSLMYTQGIIARIDVDAPGVATYGGLQVGDTAAKAREALGAALNAQPHFYRGMPAEFLTVWLGAGPPFNSLEQASAARGIRFETDDKGVIEHFHAGDGAIGAVEGCL